MGGCLGKAVNALVWAFVYLKGGLGWRKLSFSTINRAPDEQVPDCEKVGAFKFEGTGEDLQASDLATGDILLFSRTHLWGNLTQLLDRSPWDHVAMVVKSTDPHSRSALISKQPLPTQVNGARPHGARTGELTMSFSRPCQGQLELMDCVGTGPFVYPLHEVMVARGSQNQYCMARRLVDTKRPYRGMSPLMRIKLERWVEQTWAQRASESNPRELLSILCSSMCSSGASSLSPADRGTAETLGCSDVVAEAWQQAGLLDETLNGNQMSPSHFAPGELLVPVSVGDA
jgi:hypothetical protein